MVVRHDAERPLVVVPALNEEKRIEAVIDRLRRAAPDVDAIHFRYCFAYSTGGRRSAGSSTPDNPCLLNGLR